MKTNLLKSMYATIFMAAMFLVSCDNNADQQGTETEEEQTLESASISEDETDDVEMSGEESGDDDEDNIDEEKGSRKQVTAKSRR